MLDAKPSDTNTMSYQHRKVQLDHRTIDRHVPTLKRRNDSGSFVAEAYREGVPIETKGSLWIVVSGMQHCSFIHRNGGYLGGYWLMVGILSQI